MYCRASYALRFPPYLRIAPTHETQPIKTRCAFRRLLSDGSAVSRLEVGFRHSTTKGSAAPLDSRTCLTIVDAVLGMRVRVPTVEGGYVTRSFLNAGHAVAAHYLHATTRLNGSAPAKPDWWVVPGQPLLLLEYDTAHVTALPRFVKRVDTIGKAGVELSHCRIEHSGKRVGLWLIGLQGGADRSVVRSLRLHLFRLHAERECLKHVLRVIIQRKLAVTNSSGEPPDSPSNLLQQYLLGAGELFSNRNKYGLPQPDILTAAYAFDDLVTEGERSTLLSQLAQIRNSVKRTVSAYTAQSPDSSGGLYVINNSVVTLTHETRIGRQTMTTNQVNIGDNATISHSNIAAAEKIVDSLKNVQSSGADPEMKKRLEELHTAVAELIKKLPEDKAQSVTQDLQALSAEATAKSPRRKWYELSADGLIEAATTVAAMSDPVTKAVKAVLALLA